MFKNTVLPINSIQQSKMNRKLLHNSVVAFAEILIQVMLQRQVEVLINGQLTNDNIPVE